LSSYESEIAAGTVVVLYLDQCHLIWDDARGYIWGPSDQRLEIPIVNQRERQTYYGAIDALSGEMTVIPFDEANGYWTMIFVEYLRQQYEGKRLVLCWDGASYHRGEEMREYLEGLNMGRKPEDWLVVSASFRGGASIVFGVIARHDQMKDDQATQVIGKGPNLVSFGSELTEKAFQ